MTTKLARCTFNGTARAVFETNNIQFKLDGGEVLLRSVLSIERNTIKLETSPDDKGCLADIGNSSDGKKLMEALEITGFSSKEPYFLLRETGESEWTLVHYAFDKAPPKHQPYLRVWPLYWQPSTKAPQQIDLAAWNRGCQVALVACDTVHESRGRGRSKDLRNARRILSGLKQLVRDVEERMSQAA